MKEEFLSKATTKHLLALFKRLRVWAYSSYYYWEAPNWYIFDGETSFIKVTYIGKGAVEHELQISYEELKEELSKRENLRTSKENKHLRQYFAYKHRKGRKDRRNLKNRMKNK